MAGFQGASFGGSSLGSSGGGGSSDSIWGRFSPPGAFNAAPFAPIDPGSRPRMDLGPYDGSRPRQMNPLFMPGAQTDSVPEMDDEPTSAEIDGERETYHSVGEALADPRMLGAGKTSISGPAGPDRPGQPAESSAMAEIRRDQAASQYKAESVREGMQSALAELRNREQATEAELDMMGTPRQRGMLKQMAKRDLPFAQMDRMFLMLGGGLAGPEERAGRGAYAQSTQRGIDLGYGGAVKRVQDFEGLSAEVQRAESASSALDQLRMERKALAADAERFDSLPPEQQEAAIEEFRRNEAAKMAEKEQKAGDAATKDQAAALEDILGQWDDATENMDDDEKAEAAAEFARRFGISPDDARARLDAITKGRLATDGETVEAEADPRLEAARQAIASEFPNMTPEEIEAILAEAQGG